MHRNDKGIMVASRDFKRGDVIFSFSSNDILLEKGLDQSGQMEDYEAQDEDEDIGEWECGDVDPEFLNDSAIVVSISNKTMDGPFPIVSSSLQSHEIEPSTGFYFPHLTIRHFQTLSLSFSLSSKKDPNDLIWKNVCVCVF